MLYYFKESEGSDYEFDGTRVKKVKPRKNAKAKSTKSNPQLVKIKEVCKLFFLSIYFIDISNGQWLNPYIEKGITTQKAGVKYY